MIAEADAVRLALRSAVLRGYDPRQDSESIEDHGVDWSVLSAEEFAVIKGEARAEAAAKPRDAARSLGSLSADQQLRTLLRAFLDSSSEDLLQSVALRCRERGILVEAPELADIARRLTN